MRQLVEAGADIAVTDSRDCSPLHYACASDIDSEAKVAYLVQRGALSQIADTCASEHVVLRSVYSQSVCLAARHNHTDRIKELINDHGASVNDIDWYEYCTALHIAAEKGYTEIVQVLISNPQCDFSITDSDGRTAAAAARRWLYDDIAELIEAKSKGIFTKYL